MKNEKQTAKAANSDTHTAKEWWYNIKHKKFIISRYFPEKKTTALTGDEIGVIWRGENNTDKWI